VSIARSRSNRTSDIVRAPPPSLCKTSSSKSYWRLDCEPMITAMYRSDEAHLDQAFPARHPPHPLVYHVVADVSEMRSWVMMVVSNFCSMSDNFSNRQYQSRDLFLLKMHGHLSITLTYYIHHLDPLDCITVRPPSGWYKGYLGSQNAFRSRLLVHYSSHTK
jgi:hypothetical protein